jgi:hypothetical protein
MFIETKPKPQTPENRKPLDCLGSMSQLQWLIQKTKQIEEVNNWLYSNLRDPLRAHCNCLAVHPQHLVISVNNANWAQQVRLQSNSIIAGLTACMPQLNGLQKIKVKIPGSALR